MLTIERFNARHELLPATVPGDHLAQVHHIEGVLLHAALHNVADHPYRRPRALHHRDTFFFHDLHLARDFEPCVVHVKFQSSVRWPRNGCQVLEPGGGGPLALVHKCQLQQK